MSDHAPAPDHHDEGEGQQDKQEEAQPSRKKGPRWGFIILGIVVVVGAVLFILNYLAHRNELTTDDAYTDGRALAVAPQVSGQVISLEVNDNQPVRAGQVLLHIDPRDYLTARDQAAASLAAVQAQLANAEANLAIKRVTEPAMLAQAKAQLVAAQAVQTRAARDYLRFRSIDPAATTTQNLDQANAANRQAEAQVAQAQAQVDQADTVGLDLDQARSQIRQLDGQAAQRRAQLAQADLNLGYTTVVAPQAGWVTRRNVEAGNYVTAGTSLISIVTPDVWVTANFKEDQLARMRPGQRVKLRVDAYPQLKLEGYVQSVQLGSGSKFSAFPAENATGNYVKIVQRVPVKIVIDRGLDPNLPLPLGISVEPTVDVR